MVGGRLDYVVGLGAGSGQHTSLSGLTDQSLLLLRQCNEACMCGFAQLGQESSNRNPRQGSESVEKSSRLEQKGSSNLDQNGFHLGRSDSDVRQLDWGLW